jgi:hypothetical protein
MICRDDGQCQHAEQPKEDCDASKDGEWSLGRHDESERPRQVRVNAPARPNRGAASSGSFCRGLEILRNLLELLNREKPPNAPMARKELSYRHDAGQMITTIYVIEAGCTGSHPFALSEIFSPAETIG